ncbi:MAG TPA: sulfotransferase family protein, partial [Cyanobacteria bacterium UBA12227]|nr:sulfotransferase family protein [Cyanobacteria bacterium UBA12227]
MAIQYNVILGCPRSGTTFLIQALNALSNSECVSSILLPVTIPHIVNDNLLDTSIYNSISFGFEASLINYLDSGIPGSRFRAFHKWIIGCMSIQEFAQS